MNGKIRARRTLTLLCGITTGLFTACAWATWIVITRSGVHTTLTSYDITALRFLVSGIIMLPFAVRRSSPFTRIGMIRSLILSAGTGIPYVLLSIGGLAFAPATHTAIIVPGGVPLFNAVFSRWFERNRPSLLYRCGLYLILAGILMIG